MVYMKMHNDLLYHENSKKLNKQANYMSVKKSILKHFENNKIKTQDRSILYLPLVF